MSRTHLVLIPSYNSSPQLLATAESARQFWDPVWVVVDGSTDGSDTALHDEPGLRVLRLPIAHADGRYQASPETLKQLEGEGRIALRYCDARGAVTPQANPNGSVDNIAGIYGGPRRNVLGLMPHPEHAVDPLTGSADGLKLFESIAVGRVAAAA